MKIRPSVKLGQYWFCISFFCKQFWIFERVAESQAQIPSLWKLPPRGSFQWSNFETIRFDCSCHCHFDTFDFNRLMIWLIDWQKSSSWSGVNFCRSYNINNQQNQQQQIVWQQILVCNLLFHNNKEILLNKRTFCFCDLIGLNWWAQKIFIHH